MNKKEEKKHDLSLVEIRIWVEAIDESKESDPERSIGLETALYVEFVRHVAESGTPMLKRKAEAVLKATALQYKRSY